MCQMYAIFEEVVGPQPSLTNKNIQQTPDDEDQGIDVTAGDQNTTGNNKDHVESQSQYETSRSRPKRNPGKTRVYGSSPYQKHLSSTLPRSGRRRAPSIASSDLDDTASICSSNPLLDTISVLTYDPPDDSDDYYDITERSDQNGKATSGHPEGDRDSIGYSGSSSIDSGYKSFCPTPEIPDPSIYGPDASGHTQSFSGFYSDSTSSPQNRSIKPRIMMGTKVISRQGHVSPLREPPGSRRSDASLYDVNLDHLMYLRQSLLSAIQKCESSSPDSFFAHKERRKDVDDCSINPVQDQCYSDNSAPKPSHPSYTKTVRFNTDVKVTMVNSSDSASSHDTKSCRTSEVSPGEQNGPKTQSKSILKDPLCANLRSQLEAGSADCTLEEEIDSLLYGRAEFYDLENVDDFPCSYVTMIEDKYRSAKPSIAKVRKLKGDKAQEETPKQESSPQSTPSSDTVDDARSSKSAKEAPSDSSATVLISKQAKCRFTEVARCMLEIIEDLQTKKLQPSDAKDSSGAASSDASTSVIPSSLNAKSSSEDKPDNASNGLKSDNDCYMAAAEYHVYEEIDYDFVSGTVPDMKSDIPPPLPARPSVMFMKPDSQVPQKKRAPSPPPRKGRCPIKKSAADGSSTEVRNRPKQRGNLYCLFSDRVERRNISRSLEREWRTTGASDNQEDDYGFKKEFPSI